jgi:CheY-like chemotaxis protein
MTTRENMKDNSADTKPILIVENLPANQELFSLQLRQLGYSARHAPNGRVALEMFQANPESFSMILMDLQMPTTILIRQHEATTGTHVIIVALTANYAENIREQCQRAGMDDFVHKPMTLDKLNQLVTKWLKEPR